MRGRSRSRKATNRMAGGIMKAPNPIKVYKSKRKHDLEIDDDEESIAPSDFASELGSEFDLGGATRYITHPEEKIDNKYARAALHVNPMAGGPVRSMIDIFDPSTARQIDKFEGDLKHNVGVGFIKGGFGGATDALRDGLETGTRKYVGKGIKKGANELKRGVEKGAKKVKEGIEDAVDEIKSWF